MWIHLNLIFIGMLTIFVPCMYYSSPNAAIIFSTFLFFSGIYLTTLYFIMFYYKETKEKIAKDCEKLEKEVSELKKEKEDLESRLQRR